MLHLRPDLVDMAKAYPMPGKGERPFFHYPHTLVSKDGHQGDPTKATPEMGARFYTLAVEANGTGETGRRANLCQKW